jgi:hypothetical protein
MATDQGSRSATGACADICTHTGVLIVMVLAQISAHTQTFSYSAHEDIKERLLTRMGKVTYFGLDEYLPSRFKT